MRYFFFLTYIFLSALPLQAQSISTLPWDDTTAPKHEVRATWLTVIERLDWPKATTTAAQKQELIRTLDQLQQAGINTVLVHTRVRATTIYPSSMEPWDGSFSGKPGVAPTTTRCSCASTSATSAAWSATPGW